MQVPAASLFLLKQVSECFSFLHAVLVSLGQQGQQKMLARGGQEGKSSTSDPSLSLCFLLSASTKWINQNLHEKGPWAVTN